MDKQTELALNLRDAIKIITDSANEYIRIHALLQRRKVKLLLFRTHFYNAAF